MLFLPIRQINLHNRSAVRTPYDKGGIRMKKTFFAFIAIIVIGSCCMYGKTNALTNFSVSDQADSKNKRGAYHHRLLLKLKMPLNTITDTIEDMK